jgi:hypothetical protein
MDRGQFLRLSVAAANSPAFSVASRDRALGVGRELEDPMRGLSGGLAGAGLPSPATLEHAGARLDRLVTTPGFTNP